MFRLLIYDLLRQLYDLKDVFGLAFFERRFIFILLGYFTA